MAKLTHIEVESAKPREKPYRMFDGQGMYLEVQPTGSRWWRFKYRFGGKESRNHCQASPGSTDARRQLLSASVSGKSARQAQEPRPATTSSPGA